MSHSKRPFVSCSFSGDCNIKMESFIEYAIKNDISSLCFTDHHDLDFAFDNIVFELDITEYSNKILELRDLYKGKIDIFLGIELGIQPHLYTKLNKTVHNYPFDFVIASSHTANGLDPYESTTYFNNRTQHEGYLDYFKEVLQNVKSYDDYDCYGHLDYVIRYGEFKNKTLNYNLFKDLLDEILLTIINKGKGIELNTSGFRYGLKNPHPNIDILTRYKELGGEIITIGSDAHRPEDLCSHFINAQNILKELDYKYYTVFKNRKAEFIKL